MGGAARAAATLLRTCCAGAESASQPDSDGSEEEVEAETTEETDDTWQQGGTEARATDRSSRHSQAASMASTFPGDAGTQSLPSAAGSMAPAAVARFVLAADEAVLASCARLPGTHLQFRIINLLAIPDPAAEMVALVPASMTVQQLREVRTGRAARSLARADRCACAALAGSASALGRARGPARGAIHARHGVGRGL